MNKRIFSAISALITLLLCGCQLAQPEGGNPVAEPDILVGAFLTTDYIDLFDMEAWLRDNAGSLASGETVDITESSGYQGRIYAELAEDTGGSGEARATPCYRFRDLEGIMLACYRMLDPNNPSDTDSAYWSIDCGEVLCDVHTAIKSLDSGTVNEITGSLFLSRDAGDVIFYLNPVYQTAGGEVYLVPGSGMHISPSPGGSMSRSVSGTSTVTENGETKTYSCKAEVKIDFLEVAEKVVLIQMDENNTEIGRAEFIPGEMPEEFIPMENAAYLIIEEHRPSGIYRSTHQSGYDPIEVFYAPEGMICIPDCTTVKWAE